MYVLCCPVNGSVCFVYCVFDDVCELFGETIRNMFGCVCNFVVEYITSALRKSIKYKWTRKHVYAKDPTEEKKTEMKNIQ